MLRTDSRSGVLGTSSRSCRSSRAAAPREPVVERRASKPANRNDRRTTPLPRLGAYSDSVRQALVTAFHVTHMGIKQEHIAGIPIVPPSSTRTSLTSPLLEQLKPASHPVSSSFVSLPPVAFTMVSQSSQRTLAQPPRPADPARNFNERSHGIMRKIHTLTTALSDFGVQIALLIKTPEVEFTYESEDGMLRKFNTDLPEENRFRPRDVESLFQGRVLACPSINSMSPLRGRSGRSSPTPSTSSASSASSAPSLAATGLSFPTLPPTHPASTNPTLPSARPTSVSPPLAAETDPTLPASPSPPQGASLSFPSTDSGPTWMSDFPPLTSPVMDISHLLNLESWPAASDVPFPDTTAHRPLPASRPIRRPTTPTPSTSGRFQCQSPYRVLKVTPSKPRRK
ncbi:hypothetical protein VTK56DRAFT_6630 [Thermocarpiscus australiensis]